MRLQYSLYAALAACPLLGRASLNCRPEGPVLPRPTNLVSSPTFVSAAAGLTSAFDAAISGSIKAGWAVENVSFSVAVVSIDQADPAVPIWEYHHLAAANPRGTKKANRDSQYLIGSISKMFTDYLLLKSGLDMDAPVTKYLPQLLDPAANINWSIVSLRMLGSHLAGIPTDYGFSEFYYLKDIFESAGFPSLNTSSYPPCGVIALNKACDVKGILDGMIHAYPVAPPLQRPAYSSIAYTIIALAMEQVTGKNFTELMSEFVSEPYGMYSTLPSPGDESKAVIPPGENSWGSNYGLHAPGGGLVSSISDLSKFTQALLSQSADLTPIEFRQWMKPNIFAGGPNSAVGTPWEIFRSSELTPNHPHPVTLYQKSGGAQLYASQLSLVEEYGVALIVLTAGDMEAVGYIRNAMLSTFIAAIDAVSREQAEPQYARTFTSTHQSSQIKTVEVTLTQDNDSLKISSLQRDGVDILKGLTDIWSLTIGSYGSPIGRTVRLFPSELTSETTLCGHKVVQEIWTLWPEVAKPTDSDLPGVGFDGSDCTTWTIAGWVDYGGEPLNRIIFYRDEQGAVVGLEMPFLRSGVLRPAE